MLTPRRLFHPVIYHEQKGRKRKGNICELRGFHKSGALLKEGDIGVCGMFGAASCLDTWLEARVRFEGRPWGLRMR